MIVHPYKKNLQELWKSFRLMFQKNVMVRWTTGISVLFLIATTALPIWRILPLASETPFIALHYNIYLGVDRLGPISQIFFLPALGTFFLLVNLLIQARSFRTQKTLALFFAAATPCIELILLVAMGLIVLINV
ncbi:MAG: hypothetical protein UY76_C0032G0006 [Candidatus Uhrbacteria bacterium GW2011_GWA2_52_8d]|uniref:DUF1648 domain-containing protein n=1 Tax=Candidatus Uhrbacteria bacterium GW2011_GWA2_52_8d TaxID=1618979 RepID=A0A0G1XN94_9BACT|nr:MAG: hypothetical protein UY76_C0032G0006 [Candidatus Uhrbacteria bacterium GW2011_GWA2_52_8d]